MKKIASLFALTGLFIGGLMSPMAIQARDTLTAGDKIKGKKTHDQHCQMCHKTEVYSRPNKRIKTLPGLIGQVQNCNQQIGGKLTKPQTDDVITYLNSTFYKF